MKSPGARLRVMACIAFNELFDKHRANTEAKTRNKVGITKAQEKLEKVKKINETGTHDTNDYSRISIRRSIPFYSISDVIFNSIILLVE